MSHRGDAFMLRVYARNDSWVFMFSKCLIEKDLKDTDNKLATTLISYNSFNG